MKFLCVVPIYNEETKLKELIKKIKISNKKMFDVDFLLINNGSTDRSSQIIKMSGLNYVNLDRNYGVGYALIFGLKYGIKKKYKFLIHLAGNGKMLPEEINLFKKKILDENYSFINGSRFLPNGHFKTNPIGRVVMIKILSFFISLIYFRKITDATCGFRAFKINLFKNFITTLDQEKFYTYRYEYYSLGKVMLNKKIKFSEIPITMKYTKKNYSKIRPIIDWIPLIFGWIEALIDGKKL
jgi:dolichol-phosphate mannosyltransferase